MLARFPRDSFPEQIFFLSVIPELSASGDFSINSEAAGKVERTSVLLQALITLFFL